MRRRYTEPTLTLLRLLYRLRYLRRGILEELMGAVLNEESLSGRLNTLIYDGLVARAKIQDGFLSRTYWYLTSRGWRIAEDLEGVSADKRVKLDSRFDLARARHYEQIADIYVSLTKDRRTWNWLSHYRFEYGTNDSNLVAKQGPACLFPDATVDLDTHRVHVELVKQSESLSYLKARFEKYQQGFRRGNKGEFLVVVSQSPTRIDGIKELIERLGLPAVVVTRSEAVQGIFADPDTGLLE